MKILNGVLSLILAGQTAFSAGFSKAPSPPARSERADAAPVALIGSDALGSFDVGTREAEQSSFIILPETLAQVSDPEYAAMLLTGAEAINESDQKVPVILHRMKAKDANIHSHLVRVGTMAGLIAMTMGLPPEQIESALWGGRFHDIGKIDAELNTLANKALPLTPADRERLHQHPRLGAEILSSEPDIPPAVLAAGVNAALNHHERWDGTGYPRGLRGEHIPLVARIVTMADRLDAMVENRAYRPGLTLAEALSILKSQRSFFDPNVWTAFWKLAATLSERTIAASGRRPPL